MDLSSLLAGLGPVQDNLKQAGSARATTTFDGSSGGGAVKIRITGGLTVQSVTIAPAAAATSAGDVGMLEDLVATALGDALRQWRSRYGDTPMDQVQKVFEEAKLGGLMGPLLGGLGRR